MASLREQFTGKDEIRGPQGAGVSDADKVLLNVAWQLEGHLQEAVNKKTERKVKIDLHGIKPFLDAGGDLETLEGYHRLHRICASEKIDMKVEFVPSDEAGCTMVVTLDRPYSESSRTSSTSAPSAALAENIDAPARIVVNKSKMLRAP